jgi:hypothetical protein
MRRAIVAMALLLVTTSAFARSPQGGTKIQPNLRGYSNVTAFMDLVREKWFSKVGTRSVVNRACCTCSTP